MKDAKGDKVIATTNDYLKHRSFEGSGDIKVESFDLLDVPVRIIPEDQAGIKDILSPSSPNSFTFSTTSSQFNFINQQYIRLKSWMTEASEPCRSELSQVLFPLFVHLYLELLSGAGKAAAKSFFTRHHQVFRVNRDYDHTLKQIWSAAGETTNSLFLQGWKCGKYSVRLSELTLNYFLRYLQTSSNPTLLQIFNNFLEVELSELSGSQSFAVFRSADDTLLDTDTEKSSFLSSQSGNLDCTTEELNHVKDIIARARKVRPLMPSLCVYKVYNAYNGLTCAKINSDSRLLVSSFEDSVIKLWRLTPAPTPQSFSVEEDDCSGNKQGSESILFCDVMKGEGESRIAGVNRREEEEEAKGLGGRHVSGGEVCTLRGHRGPVFDVSFTHCSSYLFSVGDDAAMRLWDLKQHRCVALYQGHYYPIWCLDVTPHTIYVATGSYDQSVRLWSTECTYPVRAFIGHTSSVGCVSFHPNCSYVASGSDDRSIRLWQINDATVARILLQHSSPVKALKFSPDGKYLASGSETGEVLVWDLAAGKVVNQVGSSHSDGATTPQTPSGTTNHGEPIVALDWSKDSSVLYSASSDGYVKGTYFSCPELNESSEIGNIFSGSSTASSSLLHMSLNSQNYLSTVVTVHGER